MKLDLGIFKSEEELCFSWWLDELKEAGYVMKWFYERDRMEITKPVHLPINGKKSKTISLLRECTYTPDFEVLWWPNIPQGRLVQDIDNITLKDFSLLHDAYRSYIDTKGSSKTKKDNWSTFEVKRKALYELQKIFINKVIPYGNKGRFKCLFHNTFTPKKMYPHLFKKQKNHKSDFYSWVNWDVRSFDKWRRMS